MKPARHYFVTGTDTGVGKTLITSALLYRFGQAGFTTAGMKPVAAGCEESSSGLINEDVESLRAASNISLTTHEICPYLLSAPIAPHIAAAETATHIDLEVIRQSFDQLVQRADIVIVEGVGGFRVPLDEKTDTADLAVQLGLPIILVVGLRLGCLNHALLTAEAILKRGLSLAGWIANRIDPHMARVEQNIDALTQRLDCPLLGAVPFYGHPNASQIELNIDSLKPNVR